jgi:hypothetical protein
MKKYLLSAFLLLPLALPGMENGKSHEIPYNVRQATCI